MTRRQLAAVIAFPLENKVSGWTMVYVMGLHISLRYFWDGGASDSEVQSVISDINKLLPEHEVFVARGCG
jgi:hypothetical protein